MCERDPFDAGDVAGDPFVDRRQLPYRLYGAEKDTKWWHADYSPNAIWIISRITANEVFYRRDLTNATVTYKRFEAAREAGRAPMEFSHSKMDFQVALDSGKFTLKPPEMWHDSAESTVFELSHAGVVRYHDEREEIKKRGGDGGAGRRGDMERECGREGDRVL